jgi:hypothetical protein
LNAVGCRRPPKRVGENWVAILIFREQTQIGTAERETDLLKCYELWVKTRSERAAEKLREAGINPTEPPSGKKQDS